MTVQSSHGGNAEYQIRRFYSGDWDRAWGWTDWGNCTPEEAAHAIALNRPDIQTRQYTGDRK